MYPQEFSHRSIYDFLLPSERQHMSKMHRCLLENAVQHQEKKTLSHTIQSSFQGFHSTSIDALSNIANGSLTLKQKLKFQCSNSGEQEMNCRLFLGGGLGADLFDSNSLQNLYIVCTLIPVSFVPTQGNNSNKSLQQIRSSSEGTCALEVNTTLPDAPVSVALTSAFHLPPLLLNNSLSTSPTVTNYSTTEGEDERGYTHDDDYYEAGADYDTGGDYDTVGDYDDGSSKENSTTDALDNMEGITHLTQESSPTLSHASSTSVTKQSMLDRFRYKPYNKRQHIHPHELYYLHTTSSRLSSEALARTAYPYMSTHLTDTDRTAKSSTLAAYNSLMHGNKKSL